MVKIYNIFTGENCYKDSDDFICEKDYVQEISNIISLKISHYLR